MTAVTILPILSDRGGTEYRAIAGHHQSSGKTVGEALDALTHELTSEELGTLVVVQHQKPDPLFTAEQQERLKELMECWRTARDSDSSLSREEQTELDALVEAEVRAATDRATALADELRS
ncbi:MAG: hypothetical protein H8E44_13505 [Planctomycetes bacterium]|nr:hypothetical protein [Planctomycetota bacterium]MBL7039152.1 hypothetical protein [Pirellulaceae bacterium]